MVENNMDLDAFNKAYQEKLSNHENVPGPWVRKAVLDDLKDLVKETSKEDLLASTYDGSTYGTSEPIIIYSLDDLEMTKLLLAKGMDVNAPNWFGKTASMYAAQWDMPRMVKTLIEAHADVNIATPEGDNDKFTCSLKPSTTGRTALMYAAENASLSVIRELLDAGADKSKKNSGGRTAFDLLAANHNLQRDDLETAKKLLSVSD